jgi:hypothetical protein
MSHRHHLNPRHAGGSDSPENLTPPIPVVRHAMFHWCEWRRTGNEFDRIAWKTLSGLVDKEEARILASKEWHRLSLVEGTHPFLRQNRPWDQSSASKKSAQAQLERGTLNLLKFNTTKEHSERVSSHQAKLVSEGSHHFLRGNETWDRSEVAQKNARKQILAGTLKLLPQNRTWDQSALAKETRANMNPEAVRSMVRKQTVNRRINAGWTKEKMLFILEHLPKSSGKLLKLCQEKYSWPSSKGAMQNIVRVLETEGLENVFNYNLAPS